MERKVHHFERCDKCDCTRPFVRTDFSLEYPREPLAFECKYCADNYDPSDSELAVYHNGPEAA